MPIVETPGLADEKDEFEPIPNGDYLCQVAECAQETGKESGEPYLAWEFTVADGEHAGRKLWVNTTQQVGKRFLLKRLLTALNLSMESFDTDDAVGQDVLAKVANKTSTYQGEERTRPEITSFSAAAV